LSHAKNRGKGIAMFCLVINIYFCYLAFLQQRTTKEFFWASSLTISVLKEHIPSITYVQLEH